MLCMLFLHRGFVAYVLASTVFRFVQVSISILYVRMCVCECLWAMCVHVYLSSFACKIQDNLCKLLNDPLSEDFGLNSEP